MARPRTHIRHPKPRIGRTKAVSSFRIWVLRTAGISLVLALGHAVPSSSPQTHTFFTLSFSRVRSGFGGLWSPRRCGLWHLLLSFLRFSLCLGLPFHVRFGPKKCSESGRSSGTGVKRSSSVCRSSSTLSSAILTSSSKLVSGMFVSVCAVSSDPDVAFRNPQSYAFYAVST